MSTKIDQVDPVTRADIYSTKAQLAFEQDNIQLSDSLYTICQKIYIDKYGPEHPLVAEMLNARAMVERNKGDFDTAEQFYRQALAMRRKLLGDDHPDVAHTLNHLGRLMYQMGKYDEAEKFTREGLALREKIFGNTSPETGASMSNLAHILTKTGKLEEATGYYLKVMDMMNNIYAEPHPYKAITTINYGCALYWLGQFNKSEFYLRSGLKQMDGLFPPDHPRRTGGMIALANLLTEKHKFTEALPLLKKAWKIRVDDKSDSDSDAAEAENALGYCLIKMGNEVDGRQHLDHSYEILKKNTNDRDPSVVQVKQRFAEFSDNQISMK